MSGTPNLLDAAEKDWAERHESRPADTLGWETQEPADSGLGRVEYLCDACGKPWNYPVALECAFCGGSVIRTTYVNPTPLELTAGNRIRRALGLEKVDPPPTPLSEPLRVALRDVRAAAEDLSAILERLEIAIGAQPTENWSDIDRRWLGRLQLGCGNAHGGDVSRESLSLPLSAPLKALVMLAGEAHPEPRS